MRRSLRAPVRAALPAIAVCAVLTACTGPDNSPKFYGDELRSRFMSGCTADYEGTAGTLNTSNVCECEYQVFVDNVPASTEDKEQRDGGQKFKTYDGKTFAEIDHEAKGDVTKITSPDVVKQNVIDQVKTCPDKVKQPGNTGGSGTTQVVGPVAGTTPGTAAAGTTPGTAASAGAATPR